MLKKKTITNLVFVGFFAVTVSLAGFGFFSFKNDLSNLDKASQENISWPSMRLEVELLRFVQTLHAYEADHFNHGEEAAVSPKQINQRFDILWSKAAVFGRGRVGARLREYDAQTGIVNRLFEEIQNRAGAIETIELLDSHEVEEIFHIFDAFLGELRELSKAIFIGEERILAEILMDLRRSANTTLSLSISSVGFLLLALVYSMWQGRRFRILAESNRVLADIAQKASQAKTRFLTMMSHELRTPMNGVLGLLALLKQSKTTEPQAHIIGQAERSANQMISMLTDILDFSALQNDDILLEIKSFEVALLADALQDMFGPEARRAGIDFDVSLDNSGPTRVNSDFRRLKQIYAQLASYFIDLAGVRDLNINLAATEDMLTAKISFSYSNNSKSWTPDLVLGGRVDNPESFAAEALGPAVARGLIAKMGGELVLRPSEGEKIVLSVHIPVSRQRLSKVNVLLDMSSDVMETICKTALRGSPIEFVTSEIPENVHVVLFETGGLDEAERVEKLHKKHPAALIIAIGRPINQDIFDSAIPIPNQISEKIGIVVRDIAS